MSQLCSHVTEKRSGRLTECGGSSDVGAVLVCCGEEKTQCESKVGLRSYPHLLPVSPG